MENNEIDNKQKETNQLQEDNKELILDKFKSVDELAKAYQNIQAQLGSQSSEIGLLRKKACEYDELQNQRIKQQEWEDSFKEYINQVIPKYKKEEYFLNPDFQNLFKAAYGIAGDKLDTDHLISLLDAYVAARLNLKEKSKAAQDETENIKAQMKFQQSEPKQTKQNIPNMSDMSADEIDKLIAKYI